MSEEPNYVDVVRRQFFESMACSIVANMVNSGEIQQTVYTLEPDMASAMLLQRNGEWLALGTMDFEPNFKGTGKVGIRIQSTCKKDDIALGLDKLLMLGYTKKDFAVS